MLHCQKMKRSWIGPHTVVSLAMAWEWPTTVIMIASNTFNILCLDPLVQAVYSMAEHTCRAAE
ncbi:hypothetical protein C1H69_11975 [Billgrantia endophytica]|uniref:Uncharacterized protein n=1 Tax=Billgrantia endophytica TaxID=2033802 RepID=A0A2N7U343_9GAMM|nr:hypothetical protein C1H69_11975 [Halomonas endophytica]